MQPPTLSRQCHCSSQLLLPAAYRSPLQVRQQLGMTESSATDAAGEISQLQASVERQEILLTRARSDHVEDCANADQDKKVAFARCEADKAALRDQLASEAAQVQMLKSRVSEATAANRLTVEQWESKHRLQGADLRRSVTRSETQQSLALKHSSHSL